MWGALVGRESASVLRGVMRKIIGSYANRLLVEFHCGGTEWPLPLQKGELLVKLISSKV
jgi:hypothetical protein